MQVDTDATLQHVLDAVVAKIDKMKEPSISFQVRPFAGTSETVAYHRDEHAVR